MGRRRFLGRVSGRDCSSYDPGLYTVSELDQMIFVDGYIPVANATELNNIRTGIDQTMGAGTCWENTYLTGLDKKYVQVLTIDAGSFGTFSSLSLAGFFTGKYDGNELVILNLTCSNAGNNPGGLFGSLNDAECRNIIIVGSTFYAQNISRTTYHGSIAGDVQGNTAIDNCIISYSTVTKGATIQAACMGAMAGYVSGTSTIRNSASHAVEIINNGPNNNNRVLAGIGGFVGQVMIGAKVEDCLCDMPVFTGTDYSRSGGFVGALGSTRYLDTRDAQGGIVERCKVINGGTLTMYSVAGGFVGLNHGIIRDCSTDASVVVTNDTNRFAGGFVGYNRTVTADINDALIENCKSSGNADGAGGNYCAGFVGGNYAVIKNSFSTGNANGNTYIAGFAGLNSSGTILNSYSIGAPSATLIQRGFCGNNTGTITDCYWDTDTSGMLTSSGGTGQTTVQLQAPTSNTGIYSTWDPLIWDFGTSSEYPKLINTP